MGNRVHATGMELYAIAAHLGPVDAELVKSAADELIALRSASLSQRVLVRTLDVALNGEAGAAKQASLCDIVSQVQDQRWKLVRSD